MITQLLSPHQMTPLNEEGQVHHDSVDARSLRELHFAEHRGLMLVLTVIQHRRDAALLRAVAKGADAHDQGRADEANDLVENLRALVMAIPKTIPD